MSLARITALLDAAQDVPAPRAAHLRAQANELAARLQPEVHHRNHQGLGVVVGVTRDGLVEVTFAETDRWAVALPANELEEAW